MYDLTPLMIALKTCKNGSITRLRKLGAFLREKEKIKTDFEEASIDLIDAAKIGGDEGYYCFEKYQKAGFKEFSKIMNMEGKTLAHIVRMIKKFKKYFF
jgi:hypothetical protein